MGLFGGFFKAFGGKPKADRQTFSMVPRRLNARYDAAVTSPENAAHWAMADGLSADAGQTAGVRRTLRNRSRYESQNNSYCRGIVLTLANDTVGTGPMLKLSTGQDDVDRIIEKRFHRWMERISMPAKLRTMVQAEVVDGESFGLLVNNQRLGDGVQLDVRLVEADQVASPYRFMSPQEVDGIEYDDDGNPVFYRVLKRHPGALTGLSLVEADDIPAENVMHLFRQDRPTQHRGIPEITPAIPLFAMLRRYTLATLSAAETAADFAAVLYTTTPANDLPDVVPFEPLNIKPRSMMAIPEGWQLGQMQAEQPTTTYGAFKTEILNEIARVLSMPFNIAACNSSAYNYSSGRLDHQTYFKSLRVRRENIRVTVLDRVFRAWADEAAQILGVIPDGAGPIEEWEWSWVWDGNEHIDPSAEASAQVMRLEANTTTLAAEYAKLGLDWEAALEQRAREYKKLQELGLPLPVPPMPQADPASKDGGKAPAGDYPGAQIEDAVS